MQLIASTGLMPVWIVEVINCTGLDTKIYPYSMITVPSSLLSLIEPKGYEKDSYHTTLHSDITIERTSESDMVILELIEDGSTSCILETSEIPYIIEMLEKFLQPNQY